MLMYAIVSCSNQPALLMTERQEPAIKDDAYREMRRRAWESSNLELDQTDNDDQLRIICRAVAKHWPNIVGLLG